MSFLGKIFPEQNARNGDKVLGWRENRSDLMHQQGLKVEDGLARSEVDPFTHKVLSHSMNVQSDLELLPPECHEQMWHHDPDADLAPSVSFGRKARHVRGKPILSLEELLPDSKHPINRVPDRQRAHRSKFSLHSISILETWLRINEHNPYPSRDARKALAESSGLTEYQVSTWFTNNRKRRLNPIEDWLSSSSEDEAVTEAALRSASLTSNSPIIPSRRYSSSRASSRSVSSAGSAFSQSSYAVRKVSSRRGSKKYVKKEVFTPERLTTLMQEPIESKQEVKKSPFQCTFCLKKVSEKAWKRHEETQHLPKSKWTCLAYGPRVPHLHGDPRERKCAFCPMKNPSDVHLQSTHRLDECLSKPINDRTFYRKDHLAQHIRNVHNGQLDALTAMHWKFETDYASHTWTCGFCGEHLTDWNIRARHIITHFKDGFNMSQWNSFRGSPTDVKNDLPITESEDYSGVIHSPRITGNGMSDTQVNDCDKDGTQQETGTIFRPVSATFSTDHDTFMTDSTIPLAKPYMCTDRRCINVRFDSLAGWRDHERDHGPSHRMYKCQHVIHEPHAISRTSICGELFDSLVLFMQHCQQHHSDCLTEYSPAFFESHIDGAPHEDFSKSIRFWCGFCAKIIPDSGHGSAIGRKMDHITDHMIHSALSMDFWLPITATKYLSTEMIFELTDGPALLGG